MYVMARLGEECERITASSSPSHSSRPVHPSRNRLQTRACVFTSIALASVNTRTVAESHGRSSHAAPQFQQRAPHKHEIGEAEVGAAVGVALGVAVGVAVGAGVATDEENDEAEQEADDEDEDDEFEDEDDEDEGDDDNGKDASLQMHVRTVATNGVRERNQDVPDPT